jgi:hypothetical protein
VTHCTPSRSGRHQGNTKRAFPHVQALVGARKSQVSINVTMDATSATAPQPARNSLNKYMADLVWLNPVTFRSTSGACCCTTYRTTSTHSSRGPRYSDSPRTRVAAAGRRTSIRHPTTRVPPATFMYRPTRHSTVSQPGERAHPRSNLSELITNMYQSLQRARHQ